MTVPLGSVFDLERSKIQKPTLVKRFLIVPIGYTLLGHFVGTMAIIKITDNNQRAETSVGNQGTIPEPKHE